MKFAFVFPGQGSQSIGMMQGFADSTAVREIFAEASEVLKQDLKKLVEEGPAEQLNSTVNTQPLMLTAGYAAYRAWGGAGGAEPAVVAGHSLGEYTALVAAGALASAKRAAVRCRAEAMRSRYRWEKAHGGDNRAEDERCGRMHRGRAGQVVEPVNFKQRARVIAGTNWQWNAEQRRQGRGAKLAVMLPSARVYSACSAGRRSVAAYRFVK